MHYHKKANFVQGLITCKISEISVNGRYELLTKVCQPNLPASTPTHSYNKHCAMAVTKLNDDVKFDRNGRAFI